MKSTNSVAYHLCNGSFLLYFVPASLGVYVRNPTIAIYHWLACGSIFASFHFFLIERKKDVPKHGPHAYVYLVRRHCYGHHSICFVCTCPVLYVRSIDLVGVVKPVGVSSRFKYAWSTLMLMEHPLCRSLISKRQSISAISPFGGGYVTFISFSSSIWTGWCYWLRSKQGSCLRSKRHQP